MSAVPPRNNNANRLGGHSSTMASNTSMSFNNTYKNNVYSKPLVNNSHKPPSSLLKTPALISHKPGINNRRPSVSTTPSHQTDNRNNYGHSSVNQYTSAKRGNHNTTANVHQGRGRGGRNSMRGNDHDFYGHGGSSECWQDWGNSNSGYSFNNSSTSFPSTGGGGGGCSFGTSGFSNTDMSNSSNMYNYQGIDNTMNVKNPNVVKLQSGNMQSQFGMSRRNNSQPKFGNPSQPPPFSDGGNTSSHPVDGNINTSFSIFDVEDVNMGPSSKYLKISPSEVDNSPRVFTCPIRDMQSWSEAGLYDGPVLFEVYGCLMISGPVDAPSGGGKEFYVRDQSATTRCVFYEIDRELPHLMKGQVHRLVGTINKKQGTGTGFFKVVSIRKADKEERLSCQQATEVSLNEMDKLGRLLGKEQ